MISDIAIAPPLFKSVNGTNADAAPVPVTVSFVRLTLLLTISEPVPLAANDNDTFVSPPTAFSVGALPVAAFVNSTWLTADAVV